MTVWSRVTLLVAVVTSSEIPKEEAGSKVTGPLTASSDTLENWDLVSGRELVGFILVA